MVATHIDGISNAVDYAEIDEHPVRQVMGLATLTLSLSSL